MKILSALTFVAIAFISVPVHGQSNLVVNGGFMANASGWVATNVSGTGFVAGGGNPPGCFYLANTATSVVAAVSQQINGLVPGNRYVAAGDYRWGGKTFVSNSFSVTVDGAYLFLAPTPADYTWYSFSVGFQASSANALLSISALDGAIDPYYIDNIVVQAVPSLAIQSGETNAILSWPTNGLRFNLQSATNFNVGSWIDVTNAPAVVGTDYSVTVSRTRQAQFFRLKR